MVRAKPVRIFSRAADSIEYRKRRTGLATFKAIRIDKAEKGTTAALAQFDEAELMRAVALLLGVRAAETLVGP